MVVRILRYSCLVVLATAVLAAAASAQTTGNAAPQRPPKLEPMQRVLPPIDREGGETIADATPITSLPFSGSGTTVGHTNDYDAVCPDANSPSPDVVYSFTRPEYGTLTIDFCGSLYDTKIYVIRANGEVIDCNDDHYADSECGFDTSRIDNLWVPAGETFYLVVDGSGGAAGHYEFNMRRWDPNEDGGVVDQGGDTIANATIIPDIPYSVTGTTAGYVNDYDEVCPYSGSTAPDVVYRYTPTASISLDIDFCHSSYDTKAYVYDTALNLIACNDDFYSGSPCYTYSSKLEQVAMTAGQTYYIVVDGYGGAFGGYQMDIAMDVPCVIDCPPGSTHENEPPLHDGYVDHFNGGCNSTGYPFQDIYGWSSSLTLCGVAGWYNAPGGAQYRDTDWFILTMGPTGAIDAILDAEYATYMFELGPQDCNAVAVIQQATGGPCLEAYMTITGYAPGAAVWFWIGSTVFAPPQGAGNEYPYVCHLDGLEWAVETEPTTWSHVKALYR